MLTKRRIIDVQSFRPHYNDDDDNDDDDDDDVRYVKVCLEWSCAVRVHWSSVR